MLTTKECRKIIDPKNKKYTDEELKTMVEFLTELMTTVVENIKEENYEKSCIDGPRIK